MSKSKAHKIEVGKSRPTENQADKSIIYQQVEAWVIRIRLAEKSCYEVEDKIKAVEEVITELIDRTILGEYPQEVIMGLARRGSWLLSLTRVIEKKGAAWQRIVKASQKE